MKLCDEILYFLVFAGYLLPTPVNSNLFRFPLKGRAIGSRLYFVLYIPLFVNTDTWHQVVAPPSSPQGWLTFLPEFPLLSVSSYNSSQPGQIGVVPVRIYSCVKGCQEFTLNWTSLLVSLVSGSLINCTVVYPPASDAVVITKFWSSFFDGVVVVVLQ